MAAVRHVRFHGRGGEGVKLAGRIVSRAAFLNGFVVQDSPVYGAERRGAPVVAFVRIGTAPILERGYIGAPDAVVVMDDSLLGVPDAAVFDGLTPASLLLVNSGRAAAELKEKHGVAGRTIVCDLSAIALAVLGRHLLSAPVAGFVVKTLGLCGWEALAEAVTVELAAAGLDRGLAQPNREATRRAFDAATPIGFSEPPAPKAIEPRRPFVLPRLSVRRAAPSIDAEATSERRHVDAWRVYRPVVDLTRCSRCFLCFALCPEGAIRLDTEHYPVVDYDHCKGCLVCVAECPPAAIGQVREDAA